jgi:hypothetical protein
LAGLYDTARYIIIGLGRIGPWLLLVALVFYLVWRRTRKPKAADAPPAGAPRKD